MRSKYTVGQIAWFEPNRRSVPARAVTVTKVGRKWITIENFHRFSVEDGREEFFGTGRLWPTQADAEEANTRNELWKEFVRQVSSYSFDAESLRAADIRSVARLLGVTL